MGKKWWQSKTIWVNALTAAGGILTAIMGADYLDGTQAAAVIATMLGVVNVLLRLVTDKPIESE